MIAPLTRAAGYGFDAGQEPTEYSDMLSAAGISGRQGTWLRVRGVAGRGGEGDHPGRTVIKDRLAFEALKRQGVNVCVIVRWGSGDWTQGVRTGGGHRLPLDLREAYERGRRLAAAYGDLVDAWEIENEPDIDFVAENPETYAAFKKAIYLGIKSGGATRMTNDQCPMTNVGGPRSQVAGDGPSWLDRKRGWFEGSDYALTATGYRLLPDAPRVIMAPLALPPGPYFERLWANGLASYTDGFNFHYYGYSGDFTGVYRQFEDAVRKLETETGNSLSGTQELRNESSAGLLATRYPLRATSVTKPLPVFITEYGYGLLDAEARNTVEGRVWQWRWFADVAQQIRTLKPEGPMAFLFNPYYEANLNEFGLTTKTLSGLTPGQLPATALTFSPADFGERKPRPWMLRIGKKVGDVYASPALAYLWDYAERHPYRARPWSVRAAPPSPVVIDFIAGDGLAQAKPSGGYTVWGHGEIANYIYVGQASWVLYNFSDVPVTGRLTIAGEGVASSVNACNLTLAAGERREIAAEVGVQSAVHTGRTLQAVFTPDAGPGALARWSTRLLPSDEWLTAKPVANFDFPAAATRGSDAILAKRPLAKGEPRSQVDGRWRVTDGVRVEERDGVWRFHIDRLPPEPLRPAIVELPLPDGFDFAPGTELKLQRRRVDVTETPTVPAVASEAGARLPSPDRPDMLDVYFRTQNGNLYQTWPRLAVTDGWRSYSAHADDFTMAFFGRAALPWRFAENRPVALVFFLRPARLPAIFEVRGARIVRVTGE